uniref:VWFA domain-containing protein n=1 Tax=Panagrolaimus davidi TaxID=227884 RepID=A0A914PVU6_9BILA
MKTLFVLFLLAAVATANVIPHRFNAACNNVNPTAAYLNCNVDLTIAMDMSSAMGNTANIATMTNSILSDFLPNFSFYETFVAALSFGSTVTSSMYWNNYADICNSINAAEETTIQVGMNFTSLSEVFQNYQIDLQHSGRNYQKVLLLLTAKTDPTEIAAAKIYADQIMADGVAIIVVALNQGNTSDLSKLGQYFYPSPDYTIPITTIPSVICSYGGQTMNPPTVNPSAPPYNPLSDAVGSPCSTNVSNVWLDIVFLVDISNSMSVHELNNWALLTLTYTNKISFGPRGPHKTRAGIITYGTQSVTRLVLKDGIDKSLFKKEVVKVKTYFNPDDNGGYVQTALKAAQTMLNDTKYIDGNPKDIRQQVIILTAAAYDDIGFKGAYETAQTLKNDGVKIFTINYISAAGFYVPDFDPLASEGYAYRSDDMRIAQLLPLGLTQVNCFCPVGSLQFHYFNGHNNTNYADCLVLNDVASLPSLVNSMGCPDGAVVAVSSQIKLDFITDKILFNSTKFGQIKQFITGAHKNDDGNWYWWGYDQIEYPVGKFPVFYPGPSDIYSYMLNYYGFNWRLNGTTDEKPFPWMCQNRACDADFICDQS